MPESIDWPPAHQARPRRRRRFLIILAVLVGIFFAVRTALSYYVDVLWFGSLGISCLVAAATGGTMMLEWPTLALFWFALRASSGVVDPIFGKPLNFFLF